MQVNMYSGESLSPGIKAPSPAVGVAIATIMTLPEFANARIVAGSAGIDQKVFATIALEHPHGAWIKGGELVFSAGNGISNEQWKGYLEKLATAGATGLVLALGPYHREFPAEATKTAENLGFPLITLPFGGELTTPIQAVNLSICMAQTAHLRRSVEVERQLIQLVLGGSGLDEIVRVIALQAGLPTLIEDRQFNLIVSSNPTSNENKQFSQVVGSNGTPVATLKIMEDDGSLKRLRNEKEMVQFQDRTMFPILVSGEIYGFLSAFGNISEDIRMLYENACSAIAIDLLKQKGLSETDQKMRRDFFRDLLFANGNISPETLHRRATYLGYQLSSSYWAIVVEFDSVQNEELLPEMVKRLVGTLNSLLSFRQALVISQVQGATILYPVKENQPNLEKVRHLAETIRQKITTSLEGWTVSIGIGELYADLLSIPRSYKEGQHAVKIGRALHGNNNISCFAELGIYRMLLQFAQSQNPNEFFCEALERLLEYDQQADKELVKTLAAFLECNGNLTETSDRLFIHRNTLKYRLERIRDITQIDLDDSENRLMLHLGLKMHQIINTLK